MLRLLVPTLILAALPANARAATLLFVSDTTVDSELVAALRADGHTVDSFTSDFQSDGSNRRLGMSMADYDAVFWSATGGTAGQNHTSAAVFANLTSYVLAGGRVFVTGADSVASPADPMLIAFVGGTGSRDMPPAPGPVVSARNSLTLGVVDLRGVMPVNAGNLDCLTGLLGDTTAIVTASSDSACVEWSLRRVGAGEIAYVSIGTSGSHWTTTTAGSAGAYNAVARNFAAAGDFVSREPGSPDIAFDVPASAAEGYEIVLEALIQDLEGDSFTFSWDLDDDGAFGQNAGAVTYTVPAGLTDGPAALRFGIEAVDASGHTSVRYGTLTIDNVEPMITSEPPEIASIESDLAYRIEVRDPAGARDPLIYTLLTGPPGMSVTPSGIVQWVPAPADITEPDETVEAAVRVDDGDGGSAEQRWDMIVSPNHRPTPPVPIYPIDMIATLDPTPRLAVQNSEDRDLDPLTYSFELDTVDSFDSPALRTSGPIAEMAGYTAWQLTEPLDANRIYYWRVVSHDGTVDSEDRSAVFYVVRDPSEMPDAGVDGGSGGAPDAGIGGEGAGCGCRAGRSGSEMGLGLLFLLGFVLRRRRRARVVVGVRAP
jgi:MYXO-CTERM domain-containing protein